MEGSPFRQSLHPPVSCLHPLVLRPPSRSGFRLRQPKEPLCHRKGLVFVAVAGKEVRRRRGGSRFSAGLQKHRTARVCPAPLQARRALSTFTVPLKRASHSAVFLRRLPRGGLFNLTIRVRSERTPASAP